MSHAALAPHQFKSMLRIAAAVVLHEGPAYLPLLERLKREHDAVARRDASSFARQVLSDLSE